MNISEQMPSWMERDLTGDSDDVVATQSAVMMHQGRWLFTGMLGEFLRVRKIPRSLSIACDMDACACVMRMEFEKGGDGMNADKRWRALYSYMEIESFGLLWNVRPKSVHGIPSSRIDLALKSDTGVRWPVLAVGGIACDLFVKDGRFVAQPDPDNTEEEYMGEAA